MPRSAPPKVLISEPHALENPAPFLPYVWAILKSHWERHHDAAACEWLPPIFFNKDPDTLLEPYADDRIAVLGLSCYTWNFSLQCALAQRVKRMNPDCLVVAGGPEPDYKDRQFFARYPYIDAIAVKDGEFTFAAILRKVLSDDRDLHDIGGLYLPGGGTGHLWTGPPVTPTVFDYSPYAQQDAYYSTLREQYGRGFFHATLETNRGCPYSCSFCDWGSSTMSKLRRFDMTRVEAEIEWLAGMGVSYLMSADANFGILERDLEIADLVCAARDRQGFPKTLYYSAAKNNPDRAIEIAKKFSRAGLCATHTLAVQHTNRDVLAASARDNISAEKQVAVAQALLDNNIPIDVQLILGIPGDSYERWKGCLADLMEWGIHEDYDTFFYSLLPNAPAAEKPFLEHWQVGTIDRITLADTAQPWREGDLDMVRMTKSRIIVESKTFSAADWVRMFSYVAHVKALHNASVTRLIAIYLRRTYGVPYLDFYQDLIEQFCAQTDPVRTWSRAVEHCYRRMLDEETALDRLPVAELPGYPYALDPSRWLFVQLGLHHDEFFDALRAHLFVRYPQAPLLASVIDHQQQMVILPSYDRRVGKRFRSDFDWIGYFERAQGAAEGAVPDPDSVPGAVVEVTDQTCGEKSYLLQPLAWETAEGDQRWIEWINRSVRHRNSARKKNFQKLRLVLPNPGQASAALVTV